MSDAYELSHGLNMTNFDDKYDDADGDRISNFLEYDKYKTHPSIADTDGDGIGDYEETVAGDDGFITNPLRADTDGDGVTDNVEIAMGADPNLNIAALMSNIHSLLLK